MSNQAQATDSNVARLTNILGFDPARKGQGNSDVLKAALEKIQKERNEKLQQDVEKILLEVMKLREEFARTTATYKAEEAKFNKGIGKLLVQLEAMAKGQAPPAEGEKEEEKPAEGEAQPAS